MMNDYSKRLNLAITISNKLEPLFDKAMDELSITQYKKEADFIHLYCESLRTQVDEILNVLMVIQKERDQALEREDKFDDFLTIFFPEFNKLKNQHIINGKKGGQSKIYQEYYDIVTKIIKEFNGDLFKRGAISKIKKEADHEVYRRTNNKNIKPLLPSSKQAENIIKKLRDNFSQPKK